MGAAEGGGVISGSHHVPREGMDSVHWVGSTATGPHRYRLVRRKFLLLICRCVCNGTVEYML